MTTLTHTIKDGQFTSSIYGLIKDKQYKEALAILNQQLNRHPNSRAALSLLGYCHYQLQDFTSASDCYEQLLELYPENVDYQLYFAQCLYQAGLYTQAMKVAAQIEAPAFEDRSLKLQAAIQYASEDYASAKALVDRCPADDADTLVNNGCLLYQEGKYQEACNLFTKALRIVNFRPDLAYNAALCHYRLRQFPFALKHLGDIIERGIRDHPELSVGIATDGMEVRSVGNTQTLHESALVEAFNLKTAIEFTMRNRRQAQEALTDMPPRSEAELDPVTLHNQALVSSEDDPTGCFQKLLFLVQQPSFPPEALANLLLLYIRHEYYDLAADLLAENTETACRLLSAFLLDFLEAAVLTQTAPELAYQKLDQLAGRQADNLRRLTRLVQVSRQKRDDEASRAAVSEYEEGLEQYIPVLMQQAKIYWDRENYAEVERIFRSSVEFCSEHDTWKLNVAHVLLMREQYKEAANFYEGIVKKNYDKILNVSAGSLANLCVAYIMVNQNEDAEELMRKIEKEEEVAAYEDPDRRLYHSCIVNLVIGTLYCAKGNYEFGISRVIKSLEPFQRKISTETWYYAKRCFLSLLEKMAMRLVFMRDSCDEDCIQFLELCERHGAEVKGFPPSPLDKDPHPGRNTVTYQARLLKSLYLQLLS
uniref:Tetratricopeptide repeat protein 30 n=2 Tax=Macrostomum lignano TaxID=282301 RepID=A0A1I8HYC1_9PLAT